MAKRLRRNGVDVGRRPRLDAEWVHRRTAGSEECAVCAQQLDTAADGRCATCAATSYS